MANPTDVQDVGAEERWSLSRMKGKFEKHCGRCGADFGSDDFDEFLKMIKEHVCKPQGVGA
jgi:hypothetical protein